jgi:branched-chain amino acid transport system substrate-binding protein
VSRVCGRDDVQGAVGAQYAAKKGIKSAYILHDKTAYGQGIAEYFKRESEKMGVKILGFAGTEEKANFDAILSPILAAAPQVIYFGGIFDQGAVLFKQARQKGYKGMFLSDDAFDTAEAAKIGGKQLLEGGGTFYSTVAGPAEAYPNTAKFQADWKAKYNADLPPFAIQSYDAAAIVIKAIENAATAAGKKMPARADVAKAVRAIKDFPGVGGTINFNKNGDLVSAKYFMVKVSSADPAQWSKNAIDQVLDIAPPQ